MTDEDNPYRPPEASPDLEALRRSRDRCLSVASLATYAASGLGFLFTLGATTPDDLPVPLPPGIGNYRALALYSSLAISAALATYPTWGVRALLATWATWIGLLTYVVLQEILDGRGLSAPDPGIAVDACLMTIPALIAIVASLWAIAIGRAIRRIEAAIPEPTSPDA